MPSPTIRPVRAALASAVALASLAAGPVRAAPPVEPAPGATDRLYWDSPDADGVLTGGRLTVPLEPRADLGGAAGATAWETIVDNGPPANRVDVVFVGDGYTEAQLATYAGHAASAWSTLVESEPLASYQGLVNVHRVDVVSPESGVDHDPTQGILRSTALHMGFWCAGIERLLCVSTGAAWAYADLAPDADHVLAVANSTKYGGAGYETADVATFAGGNGAATELALHELGHSLGNLADEYDYADGATYTGGERPEPNVSILAHQEMAAAGTKWASWIGYFDGGFDGITATFEGAYYHVFGIHRPTSNSKMRTLGRPFNPPSAEAIVIELYRLVDPIDDATPSGAVLAPDDVAFVVPVEPGGHDLEIEWRLDGAPIDGATGPSLDLATLEASPGAHELSVVVVDATPLVRDEAARARWMTSTRAWSLVVPAPGDVTGDGAVDTDDLLAVLAAWGACGAGPCPADLDGTGTVGVLDLLAVLAAWAA